MQLHRFDSKQSGYSEAKPNKTGAAGKWGGLFASYRVGFSKQKADEETSDRPSSPNSDENTEEEEVVIVHNAASAESATGRIWFLKNDYSKNVANLARNLNHSCVLSPDGAVWVRALADQRSLSWVLGQDTLLSLHPGV